VLLGSNTNNYKAGHIDSVDRAPEPGALMPDGCVPVVLRDVINGEDGESETLR